MVRQTCPGFCHFRYMMGGQISISLASRHRQAPARLSMMTTTEGALLQPSSAPLRKSPLIVGVNKYSHVSSTVSGI